MPWLFDWHDFTQANGGQDLEKAFDVALHVGTVIAVPAYFRKDLLPLGRAALNIAAPGPWRRPRSVWSGS